MVWAEKPQRTVRTDLGCGQSLVQIPVSQSSDLSSSQSHHPGLERTDISAPTGLRLR